MSRPLYFDYAATTPVDDRVIPAMQACLSSSSAFGNASSHHFYGWEANESIEQSAHIMASGLGAQPSEIVWTSGATESNNLALLGIARAHAKQGRHIITAASEHKSVLEPCKQLEKEGFEVTFLRPEPSGLITPQALAQALRPDTILVSLMMVNNEIGCVNPITALGEVLQDHAAYFHVDAVQAAGLMKIDVNAMHIDALSLSAHKFYGPKGIGILYLRRSPKVRCMPLMFGGEQQHSLRPGTLPTHQIVGMAAAFQLAEAERAQEFTRLLLLKNRLWEKLQTLESLVLNGSLEYASPHILNVSFEGLDGEALLMALGEFALSSGSACNTASIEPSHVLMAIGRSQTLAHNALRFSLGRYTTQNDIDRLGQAVIEQVTQLRALSPLWPGTKPWGFQ